MQREENHMRAAVAAALANPDFPFGAVLVDRVTDSVVARGVNRSGENPTWHGEMDVINRHAGHVSRPNWRRLELYSTAEPCAMCQAAILWTGVPRVIYGTSIITLREMGWRQINLRAADIHRAANFAKCEIVGGVLAEECDELFRSARNQT